VISMGEIEEYEIEDRWNDSLRWRAMRLKTAKSQQSLREANKTGTRMKMCVKFDKKCCDQLIKYKTCGLPKGNCQSKHHKKVQ